jgi:hypothetical protein
LPVKIVRTAICTPIEVKHVLAIDRFAAEELEGRLCQARVTK